MSSEAGRYRRKAGEVEAIQWTGSNWEDVQAFADGQATLSAYTVIVNCHAAVPSDFIVCDSDGALSTLTAKAFAEHYVNVAHQPEEQPQGEEKRWTIHVCPECGEEVPDHYGPPMLPGRGHYHDNPKGRFLKRVFHPAEAIEVVAAFTQQGEEQAERKDDDR